MFLNICKSFSQAYSFICVTIIFFSFSFDQSSKGFVNFIFLNIFLFMLLQLSQLFPLHFHPPSPPPPSIVNPHTVVRVHGSFIYVLCLIPSPSFNQSSPLSLAFDSRHFPWPCLSFVGHCLIDSEGLNCSRIISPSSPVSSYM